VSRSWRARRPTEPCLCRLAGPQPARRRLRWSRIIETCNNCGHNNSPEAIYCAVCGAALASACPSCGQENTADASFCAACGTPLTEDGAPSLALGTPAGARVGSIPRRDLGDLVGETFRVYGAHFWPFFLMALVPQVPSLVNTLSLPAPLAVLLVLASVVLSILAGGAFVHAVVKQTLGRTIDVRQCYDVAWRRVLSLAGAFILFVIALLGVSILMIVIVGIPLFFWLLVVWFFAAEAIMVEGKGPVSALGRSRELVRGSWWRLFVIGVVYVFISIGMLVPLLIAYAVLANLNEVVANLYQFLAVAAIAPIASIGAVLVYFDLRVRKEGYTLDRLAAETDVSGRMSTYKRSRA